VCRARGVSASTSLAFSSVAAIVGNLIVLYILNLVFIPQNMAPNGTPLLIRALAVTAIFSIATALISVVPGFVGSAMMSAMLRCCDRRRQAILANDEAELFQ
ncbi:MAG TPA: hypothetical protein PK402_13845, partial [Tepidisphaeraceae bacterium]|nr:hypothetical protein [Tepidisphaeraceae bacterium]